ncbi:Chemotaxis protein [gamma proteobacterium HdN1]|nr:Chemotaxis protein [gamma proteobacterium HdN1]
MDNDVTLEARGLERAAIELFPGEWAIETQRPISTLLGSCVGVCLYDPKAKIGGLNHFMLPKPTPRKLAALGEMLFGEDAMNALTNGLLSKGAERKRLVAKAFGGGNMMPALHLSIGDQNAAFAIRWLETARISLLASDLGGPWARKVVFNPLNGDTFCRRISNSESRLAEVLKRQEAYEKKLK